MVDITPVALALLQAAIFGLVLVAVRRGDVSAAANALGALGLTVLPAAVEILLGGVLARSVVFGPVLPVWIGVAGFLHSIGMLGLYESAWWWDHLTHVISATLVAALMYAGLLVALPTITAVERVPGGVSAATVVFTLAVGVFWELLELLLREVGVRFDIEPLLIHYGWRDTATDLGFDAVGALLVILVDLRIFVPVFQQVPGLTRTVLLASVLSVLVASALMALFLGLTAAR